MRRLWMLALVLVLGCLSSPPQRTSRNAIAIAAAAESQRPNIILLVADDLGWRDLGWHGSEIKTPTLDRLAGAGVKLEHHYVFPVCSPTRAALMSGRNPSRFGIHSAIGGRSEQALPLDTMTLARLLQSRGYTTALSGKWHLGLRPAVGPRKYGFDSTYGYLHGQLEQFTHLYKNGDRTWHRNDEFFDEPGHATDLIASEATRVIETKRAQPFFLYVCFSVPHYPIQEEEKWIAPYRDSIRDDSRRLYAASVAHMDAAIARIVEALDKSNQLASTLIVFTSDNGGQRNQLSTADYDGKHGPYPTLGDNRPWRGWKGEMYEGGVRVPAFAYWRHHLKPRVLNEPVSAMDWLPTLAHLAGAATQPEWNLDGRNVWPQLTGAQARSEQRALYWTDGRVSAVMSGDWKLIVEPRQSRVELYNLAEDPYEKMNAAAENPVKVEALREILEAQRALDAL